MQKLQHILGLDIGETSIGSAVIHFNDEVDSGTILHLGVRIFSEPRDDQSRAPTNQTRREKRMMRRQLRRRRERRKALNEFLSAHGFLPAFSAPEWAAIMSEDPYSLRDRALTAPLSAQELGRCLYHLAKRRHFQGRDLSDAEELTAQDADEKKAGDARKDLLAKLKASGQTLGGYLASQSKKRGHHATRHVVLDEFTKILAAQEATHPVLTEPGFRNQLEHLIFDQRPVFWRTATLGECRLLPGAKLCPKGSWLSAQKRMLEKLNNLEVLTSNGADRPLDPEERSAVLTKLQSQSSMTFGKVRDCLKPLWKARKQDIKSCRFNLEAGGETKMPGNPVEAKLKQIFGSAWENHHSRDALRATLTDRLYHADYGETPDGKRTIILRETEQKARRLAVAARLYDEYGLTETQACTLSELQFPTGWEPFSIEALQICLPELERGVKFGTLLASPLPEWAEWRARNFPRCHQPTGEVLDFLPSPQQDKDEQKRLSSLRNPTVTRIQNELRKVVNNLIRVYGKPDLIRVELARTVGMSAQDRAELLKDNQQQEKRRKEAKADLERQGIAEPARDDIEKWLLWQECGKVCPYSGAEIGFQALFLNNEFQVEHIWPQSLSLDNAMRNKTLCRTDYNQVKGQRTPFEAFGHTDEWDGMVTRIRTMQGAKGKSPGMSPGKIRRFLSPEVLDEGFTSRQLNDTAYATRQALAQLKRLWPDIGPEAAVTVQAVSGRVTAQLRHLWGLNYLLSAEGEKTRDDHRHHAVDALAVACTHPGITQKLSRYFQNKKQGGVHPHLPPPWKNIRQDAAEKLAELIVSHRVQRKISGALHKETVFGATDETDRKGSPLFVSRKAVTALSAKEIESIRDERVKNIIRDWIETHGGKAEKAFPPYPTLGNAGPEIRKVRLCIPRQYSVMMPTGTGFSQLGGNHHMAIFRLPDGKTDFQVVSLLEAARRLSRHETIVRRTHESGGQFIMSLSIGETVWFPDGCDMAGYWRAESIMENGQIRFRPSRDATVERSKTKSPTASGIIQRSGQKRSVDPIGRIRPAHD